MTKEVKVKLSEKEHRIIKTAAASAGLTMNAFIESACMKEAQIRLGEGFWDVWDVPDDEV